MKTIVAMFAAVLLAACGESEVAPQTVTVVKTVRTPVLAMMGDSISFWWPLAGAIPTIPVQDYGIPGQRSDQMASRYQVVLDNHPVIVLILAGTNDIGQLGADADITYIAQMADETSHAGIPVIIGSVPPNGVVDPGLITAFNAQLKTLCATNGYAYADYYSSLLNSDGTQNLTLFDSDTVHPSKLGYLAMNAVVEPILTKYGILQ